MHDGLEPDQQEDGLGAEDPPRLARWTPPAQTAYEALSGEKVEWLICRHGMGHSLGWRGGSAAVERCFTIFANFDFKENPRAKHQPYAKPTHAAPVLNWLYDGLGYVHMTLERLQETLCRHFYLTILLRQEVHTTFDGEGNPIRDEAKAARMAKTYAARFIAERIVTECFMPQAPNLIQLQHGVALASRERPDGLEALIGAALRS